MTTLDNAISTIETKEGARTEKIVSSVALEGSRQLQVMTAKAMDGRLRSSAHVVTIDDGILRFRLVGDFSETILISKVRCTAKAMHAQHQTALEGITETIAKAKAFYVSKGEA